MARTNSKQLPMPAFFTQNQLERFFNDGYIIVPGFLAPAEVAECRNLFQKAFDERLWECSPYNSPHILNDIYRHFPQLADLVFKPQFIAPIKSIFGDSIACAPECAVHRNRFFDWHRDTTAMEADGEAVPIYPKDFLLQTGIYFQDNKGSGGGLTVEPHSHFLPDPFVKIQHGNLAERAYFKALKLLKRSPFHRIERFGSPVDVPTKAGDLLIFNNQLNHRATFLRNAGGAPIPGPDEKFAIFNTFGKPADFLKRYVAHQKSRDIPYAKFLHGTTTPEVLKKKSGELAFTIFE